MVSIRTGAKHFLSIPLWILKTSKAPVEQSTFSELAPEWNRNHDAPRAAGFHRLGDSIDRNLQSRVAAWGLRPEVFVGDHKDWFAVPNQLYGPCMCAKSIAHFEYPAI